MGGDETRADLQATVAARSELGRAHEDELVDGFLERLDQRLAKRPETRAVDPQSKADHRFVIALVSLGTGVPITAIAASLAGLPGLIVAWAGIVGVNIAARR